MSPLEDLLVRILVAELLPGGLGSCKRCSEPLVIGTETILAHYGRRHQDVVVAGLLVAVIGIGLTAAATRSGRG